MIRVKIKHISQAQANTFKDFDDGAQADKYIEEMKASEHWGKSAKSWIEKDENGNDIEKHQGAEVEFIKEDVSAEYSAKEQKKLDSKARIEQLKTLDFSKITTVAQLKAIVQVMAKELLKDEE